MFRRPVADLQSNFLVLCHWSWFQGKLKFKWTINNGDRKMKNGRKSHKVSNAKDKDIF